MKSFLFNMFRALAVLFIAVLSVLGTKTVHAAYFSHFSTSATTVNPGQSIRFDVRSVGANNVFAAVDNQWVLGVAGDVQTDGQRMWSITFTPAVSQSVIVFASVNNQPEGASTLEIPIMVGTGTGGGTAPSPGGGASVSSPHQIISILENQTAANQVTLTVTTSASVREVWATDGEAGIILAPGFIRGTFVSSTGMQNTFTLAYRPQRDGSHGITIYANGEYLMDGQQTSQFFEVTRSAPVAPEPVAADPRITSAVSNRGSYSSGDRATITIRTNLDVDEVSLEVNNQQRVNATRTQTAANAITWTAEFRPDRQQEARVTATHRASGRTDTRLVRINMTEGDGSSGNRIREVTQIPSGNVRPNEQVIFEIRTDSVIDSVLLTHQGSETRATDQGTDSSGARLWRATIWATNTTSTVTITARQGNNTLETTTRTITVSGGGGYNDARILDIQQQGSGNTRTFIVRTTSEARRVDARIGNRIEPLASYGYISSNESEFRLTNHSFSSTQTIIFEVYDANGYVTDRREMTVTIN